MPAVRAYIKICCLCIFFGKHFVSIVKFLLWGHCATTWNWYDRRAVPDQALVSRIRYLKYTLEVGCNVELKDGGIVYESFVFPEITFAV